MLSQEGDKINNSLLIKKNATLKIYVVQSSHFFRFTQAINHLQKF